MVTARTVRVGFLSLATVTIALAGCVVDIDDEVVISLYVKDDVTTDFSEVFITFTRVEALSDGAWRVAFEGSRSIEMLSLAASTAKERLADLDLPPGDYDGLRISVSEVTAIDHAGRAHALTVVGDVLELEQSFSTGAQLGLLVDFDMDRSIQGGLFAAEAANIQRSDRDRDGDGVPDLDDADDDGDGVEDALDDDIDGDGKSDRPVQSRHGYFGLCTAWLAGGDGERLSEVAQGEDPSAFCEDQAFPGPIDRMPEQARNARALDRGMAPGNASDNRGPPADAGGPNRTGPDAPGREGAVAPASPGTGTSGQANAARAQDVDQGSASTSQSQTRAPPTDPDDDPSLVGGLPDLPSVDSPVSLI